MLATKRKRRSSRKPPPGSWFDDQAAQRALDVFRSLKHTKGEWAGKSFDPEPWQAEVISKVFGSKRPDGQRQYRIVYIEVPRKNGKSTLAAGFGCVLLYSDREPGAEVYSCAADRDQAAIVFEQAKQMVLNHEEFGPVSEVYRRSIVYRAQQRTWRVLSADAPTKHGLNAHGIIFDELHAQPNRELWDVMTTSTGARRQPLIVAITTAGWDRHSICWELHEYACKIRDGILTDDSFLPVIFAADEKDDWTAPATWQKANPSYDVTVKADYLAAECDRAKMSPAYQNTFRRLHLNQWTEQADRWIDLALWDMNDAPPDLDALKGQTCYGGLDLSTTTDLSALVLVFPRLDGFDVIPHFWAPLERIRQRSKRDRVPYDQWEADGILTATPGDVVDYAFIRQQVLDIMAQYDLRELAFDPWNAIQLATQLGEEGVTMVEVRQGFASLSAPTKELMTLLLAKKLRHGGHPILRWNASNVAVKQDPAGNLKPDKSQSTERIDGIVALIMALSRATLTPAGGWEFTGFNVETV